MITDGWVSWAIRVPGPANKVYSGSNAGEGICFHSMEGWYAGSLAELMKPDRAASWMFSLKLDGTLVQHYPITACCWASGNREANTALWSIELEGIRSMPINDAQLPQAMRLIREWELYEGTHAVRKKTMWEHREVALWDTPNAGPTACPSERYAPLWAALEQPEEPTMTDDERELMLKIATVLFGWSDGTDFTTVAGALERARELATADSIFMQGLGETQAVLEKHLNNHPGGGIGVEEHSHVVSQHRTGGVV